MISLQFKTDIARDSRAISVLNCSDITRDWWPLYQIVKDTSKIDNGYQLFQPAFGYKILYSSYLELTRVVLRLPGTLAGRPGVASNMEDLL